MRSFALRPAAAALAASLLAGTAIGLPARAETALSLPALPHAFAAPDRIPRAEALAELIKRRVGIPALPPAEVRLLDPDDVVGTVPSKPRPGGRKGGLVAVAPALSFEDRASPVMRSALLTTERGFDGLGPSGSPAGVPAPAGSAAPATAAPPVSPTAAAPAPAAATPVATAESGALASALAAALEPFVAAGVLGDTPAQSAERRKAREAIAAFYAAHGTAPLWIAAGRFSPAGQSVLARIDHAGEDALDLARYTVAVPQEQGASALARADLALSEAVVAYGRQASGSRVDVARLGGIIDFRPEVAEAGRILGTVSAAADPGEALRIFNPVQPGYAALRDKLAELRRSSPAEARSRIPPGPVLKPGMTDARVPLIRARFGLDVARVVPGVPPMVYDTKVAAAVADFQRTHGLPASGLFTPRTVAALSGGNPTRLENTIVANMEIWRWLPHTLAPDRVEVNIPDFQARVLRDGEVVHQTRVVVGQPDKPTPVFAQEMRFIIVNPYWNVPLSIINNEMLPKLASDPNYFADHGYEVVERNGIRYVRQPPGDGNALGRIKFMFPNSHSVYLHDTNARSYFARDMRALSHGCVRVEEPFAFAEAVLGRNNGWSEARVKRLIGGQERTVNLPKPLPILITYFTAYVDPQEGFQLRDDVYGYTGKVKLALNLQD